MKKKLFAVFVLCMALMLVFCGCQAALITSNVALNADGSGTKTITAVIYGDEAILVGEENIEEPGLVGNNSKYLLVSGDALVEKLKSYSGLKEVEVTAVEENGNTTLTITYAFSSLDDYLAKTKLLAGDDADKIEAPTLTDNGDGTFTYKENTENTKYSLDNIFESLYNDPEAFSKDGQGDCDLEQYGYDYTCIYTIMNVSATIGEETTTVEVNKYDESNTVMEQDWADYIEVTGKAAAPEATEATEATQATEAAQATQATQAQGTQATQGTSAGSQGSAAGNGNTGMVIGIIAACVVCVAVVAVVVVAVRKKKN